ncbi:MAG: hypothetical protein RIT19_2086 [Verrucomicrobiota bacterium]|jgi:hypothetical protein
MPQRGGLLSWNPTGTGTRSNTTGFIGTPSENLSCFSNFKVLNVCFYYF